MADTMTVLGLIKARGPVSARQMAHMLGLPEKRVRNHIDRLRLDGEPVWQDWTLKAFWWSDEWRPSGGKYQQWKRRHPDGLQPPRG